MARILVKNGRVWDGEKFFFADILTNGKLIEKIEPNITDTADYVYNAEGKIVSAGLVDIHVHLKGLASPTFGVGAEISSFPFGVTAVNDAGSTNGDRALLDYLSVKNTVFVCASIRENHANFDAAEKCLEKYGDKAIGIKAYFDKSEYAAKKQAFLDEIRKQIGVPCIVKPAKLGSSVGISICENVDNLDEIISNAFLYDNKVLVEKFVEKAREFCCAVVKVGGKIIVGKVKEVSKGRMFTFDEKYINKQVQKEKKLSADLEVKIKALATKSFKALECDGVVRIDFLMGEKNNLYVNEVNTIPGSLSFNMFDTSFEDLLQVLIESAKYKKNQSSQIVYQFNSKAIEKYISLTNNEKLGK